ncbi:30S ribosome-binding factor RbfA [bacterium]|nr:MAG: 30S ribosome-binding factor RbfA [bacterium]
MSSLRIQKINELLKQEFAKILVEEIEVPIGTLVTVIQVKTSPSLQHAKIYISVLPDKKAEEILKKLNDQIYKLQQIINKRLYMRPVPKLSILLDKSGEKFSEISKLLKSHNT